MLYNLYHYYKAWLEDHGMGFFRLFDYISFRAVLALILAFFFVVLVAKPTIRWLLKQKIGDNPEFHHKDLNQIMKQKANTPTMGGLMIVGAILFCTLLLADLTSFYIHMALICTVWLCVLGGFDDWLKLTSARRTPNSREGLKFWEKMVFQIGLAVLLGIFIHDHGITKFAGAEAVTPDMSHSLTLPFWKSWIYNEATGQYSPNIYIELGSIAFIFVTAFVVVGASNAVNLTDGMDGLASGVMAVSAFAFMVLAMIAGEELVAKYLLVPYIPLSNELAVVAGAMVGSCLGFLWFNCHPAQVFMGDTGSLTLGGLIGYLAVVIRQEFLLLVIGGVFVMEAVSVLMQVGYFRFTGGRRIFRCAPIHHHFHLGGWTEQQVVVRFWLLSVLFTAIALATIKLR